MEEGVIGGMAGAAGFEDGNRSVEVEPLADTEVKLSGVLKLFEGEEVFPAGVVLNGRNSIG